MTSDWTEIDNSIYRKQFFFFVLFDQALTLIYISYFPSLIVHSTPVFTKCGGDLLALSLAMFPYKQYQILKFQKITA